MSERQYLWDKMRALAESGHPRADELRDKADLLETGTAGYYADPPTVTVQTFLGRYARARTLWCDCTGESLV